MRMVKVAVGVTGVDHYVNLDAITDFDIDARVPGQTTVDLFFGEKDLLVTEPYASVILALLLPPAVPTAPAPKCWKVRESVTGVESLCTLPKGHPGPCRYESPVTLSFSVKSPP